MTTAISRRHFLKASATAAGGLVIAANIPGFGLSNNAHADGEIFTPNAFLEFAPDGEITFTLPRIEMGQGTYTGLTTVIAEELEVDPKRIKIEFAPYASDYINKDYGSQMTGGSNSISVHFQELREAGANTRQLLINAAAILFNGYAKDCDAHDGVIRHRPTGKTVTYADVLTIAAGLSIPSDTELKQPTQFKYIGKQNKRLDVEAKTFGKAEYGIDVQKEGMLSAAVARPPVHGGKLLTFDATRAAKMPGVEKVLEIYAGVAVVADTYWHARKALQAVDIKWDHGEKAGLTTAKVFEQYQQAADDSDGREIRGEGDFEDSLENAATVIEAEYKAPFLAHATMEPQNCTAHVQEDRCDIWAPTQVPDMATTHAADITGLSFNQIHVHTTFLGGGFGRRLITDFIGEAVAISKEIGKPVKVVWSREDDMAHDSYRPASFNRLKATMNDSGELIGWHHKVVGPSLIGHFAPSIISTQFPEFTPDSLVKLVGKIGKAQSGKGPLAEDPTSTEGAHDIPYAIDNIDVRYVHSDSDIPILFWRSVGHSQNAFVVESFLDEVAHATGKDPYEFRASLLKEDPRRLAVLKKVAEVGNWGKPSAPNRFQGIAVHKSFKSYAAQIAEVEIINNQIKVHNVTCVVDCGLVVNPDIVEMQMESCIIFGLTAALYGEITHKDGKVEQTNFHNYRPLRMNESPDIHVHIMKSNEPPTGVGEPGLPPILPAVANAVFAATGKRLREAPLRLS